MLQAIVNDPGTFFSNLGRALGQGMQNFFNHFSTTLPQQLLQWLTAGLSGLPDLPDFSNPNDVARFLLQFFKLGWQNIQPILVKNLGAGNVALVAQVYQYLTTWLQHGDADIFNWLA